MVYVHTILRDVAGLFKVGRLVAYNCAAVAPLPGDHQLLMYCDPRSLWHIRLLSRLG